MICTFTGQPERATGIAREVGQEAADRGIEVFVGLSLAMEAMAWTRAGDYAAARQPAMEAVEIARRVRNPALSAYASWLAAAVIWHSEPQAALLLVEDSLALTRAGADDVVHGNALVLAAVIRARNGDPPGALAALQEATLQHHADGSRVLLGLALRTAAGMLARLGEAGQPRCCPAPSPRISRRPSRPAPKTSGWRPTGPRLSPGTRSARPPTTPRPAAVPRWTITRSSGTQWASSSGSPRCLHNPACRHRRQRPRFRPARHYLGPGRGRARGLAEGHSRSGVF